MASVNDEITFNSGDWKDEGFSYRVKSITNNIVELNLWNVSNQYGTNGTWWTNPHPIQYNTSTGEWSDPSTAQTPDYFSTTLNGTRSTSISGYPTTLFGWALLSSSNHYWEITTPSWARQSSGSGTNTEGVNTPSVTWDANPVCGQQSYLGVLHSESQQTGTTYYVYDSFGQIGTVTVGVNAYLSPPFWFTVESGLISVQDSNGTIIGSKSFTCGKRGSLNFW